MDQIKDGAPSSVTENLEIVTLKKQSGTLLYKREEKLDKNKSQEKPLPRLQVTIASLEAIRTALPEMPENGHQSIDTAAWSTPTGTPPITRVST